MVRRSPRGQILGKLLQSIQHLAHDRIQGIAVRIISELDSCLLARKKHKLPSVAQGAVWSAFHKLRLRQDILHAWNVFIISNIPTAALHEQHELALQIILDRVMKKIIANKAHSINGPSSKTVCIRPMTVYESNAIRYMAGYVAIKLLKKYRKGSKNTAVNFKHKLFVKTLERMKALEQPGEPESPSEYSTLWMEIIDRGGLYHINDKVFHLIESIEMIVRQHFNFITMKEYVPGTDLSKQVHDQVLCNHGIVNSWEQIATDFPRKYEKYSVELLSVITDLWITIRGHSFAKGWNTKFEKKYKQGTRKTLANTGKKQ